MSGENNNYCWYYFENQLPNVVSLGRETKIFCVSSNLFELLKLKGSFATLQNK